MAVQKKITKKSVSKTVAKSKADAKKVPAKKTVTEKNIAKKAPAKKATAKRTVSQDQFYTMICEAAYFAAQNDGNKKGAVEYWLEAECIIGKRFDVQ